jgi:hypothetical protein
VENLDLIAFHDAGLAEITHRRTYSRPKPPEKAISIIHKAKGLECGGVIVVPCDAKNFPDMPLNKKKNVCSALVYEVLLGRVLPFQHLDQRGQRVCLHLLHRAAAVNLYCIFGSSKLSRDLLVKHA